MITTNNITSNSTTAFNIDGQQLTAVHYVAIILYFAYGISAVLGNLLLIVAMAKANLLKYGGFLTLTHYAIADIISGCLNVFYVPWSIACQCQFAWGCLPGAILILGEFSRKIFLIFMALTKFASVIVPLKARTTMTIDWIKKAIWVTWFVAGLSCLPFWITCSMYFDEANCKWASKASTRQLTSIYGASVNLVTTAILLVTYPVCFYKLLKNNQFWQQQQQQQQQQSSNSIDRSRMVSPREKSLLYMFTLNAVIFMLYWIPIYVFELWSVRIPYYSLVKETIRGVQVGYNPIAYCILNVNIRMAVVRMIFRRQDKSTKGLTTLSDEENNNFRYNSHNSF